MDNNVSLKNGLKVLIRKIRNDDVQRSLDFFRELPEEDRAYLRVDVTDPAIVEQRINAVGAGNIMRLVADFDDKIVADGSLEPEGYGWKQHIAELRLIIAHSFQRKGLGLLMARELFMLAAERKVEEIVVKFMETQVGAQSIFKRLGFQQDAVLHDYVKDINGNRHDLIIMRCNLNELWQKIDNYLADFDWNRTR